MERFRHLKDYKIVLSLLTIIVIILFILNEVAGFLSLILAGIILYDIATKREELHYQETINIERLCEDFDSAAQDSVFNMPFPLVLTDNLGNINWYNPPLLRLLGEQDAVGEHIDDVLENFVFEDLKSDAHKDSEIKMFGSNYVLYHNSIEKTNGETIHIFYFVDNTEYDLLREKYIDKKIGFGHIYIDNYDEIGLGKKGYVKSVIIAEVENKIMDYFTKNEAIVRRYDDDKYLTVFNQLSLEGMVEDRFSILDVVREIGKQNDSTITLSIGISETLDSIPESYEESRVAVDLALGRGGDQVVVRTQDGHEFFGGRTQAREKRNRVRARVIGNSLANLVEEASEIFIMGHKNADMDSIGSAIGMLGAVRRMEKQGFIVLNESNPSIKNILEAMKVEAPEVNEFIIGSDEAIDMAQKSKSLIIMLDHHKTFMSEEPILFDMIDKVVVIDHHRRGNDGIENAVLSYIESYASSTSELVTEILEYMEPDMNISTFEAEAMLAGIVVDTKNFTFQTGVRTFEAASILRRHGANPSTVNKFFYEKMDTVRMRAKVVHDSDIVRGEIAIARLEEEGDSNVLIAAQAADSLLNIVGVNASFVLTHKENYIHISGRSAGEISVQLILEKLGGGGHLVSAATQVYDATMDEAYEKLLKAIDKYYEEIEKKENTDEDNIIDGS